MSDALASLQSEWTSEWSKNLYLTVFSLPAILRDFGSVRPPGWQERKPWSTSGISEYFSFTKKKEECKLKLDFIWTGDGVSYSRFSGNLCTFCGWRVTFVRVGCGAVVHETIHVFKRDLGRGSQHLGEGSGIFEYLCIFHFCLQVVVRLKTHLGPWANERIARPIIFIWTILPTKAWVQFWGSSRFTRNMLKGKTRLLLSEAVNSIRYVIAALIPISSGLTDINGGRPGQNKC